MPSKSRPRTGPKNCRSRVGCRLPRRSFAGRIRCRKGRSGMTPCHRTRRWSSKRLPPDPRTCCADRGHRWLRPSIVQASRANYSFGRSRCSYFHNRHRPRTGLTRIRRHPSKAVHSCACRTPQRLPRQCVAARIGVRPRNLRRWCRFAHRHRCGRGRASNPPAGTRGRCPGRRTSWACFPPGPSNRTNRTPCSAGRACTSRSRCTGRCLRRWSDR
jgi:hypothetical protein